MEPVTTPLKLTIPPAPAATKPASFWDGEAPSFRDVLDVINPLQHLPGVSHLYRAATGDTASTGAKLAGGALFGGPLGLLSSIINAIVEQETGTDITGNLLSALQDTPAAAAAAAPAERRVSPALRAAYHAYVSVQRA